MSEDKITGSTLLPGRVLSPTIDTNEVRVGDERFTQISQDYKDSSPQSVPTSRALYEAFMQMQDAVNAIDPDNNFFRDNSVISQPLLSPTFDIEEDWSTGGWEFDNNRAIYTNTGLGDNNELYIKAKTFSFPGYHFFKIFIDRIDTGVIELSNADDVVIATFNKRGTYYYEYYIDDPNIASFRLISKGLYPNEAVIVPYIGVHRVQERIRDYLLFRLEGLTGSGGGSTIDIEAQLNAMRAFVNTSIGDMTDQLQMHTSDYNNPHYVTRALLQAAAASHTHTPASIGAATATHTHEPEECNAAPAIHGHTPEQCLAAPVVHTHIPEDCGAAPEIHIHDDYTLKTEFEQSINNLTQRIDAASMGGASDTETGDVKAKPLSITSLPTSYVGRPYTERADNLLHANFGPKITSKPGVIEYFRTGAPLSTLKSRGLMHLNPSSYDNHSGVFSFDQSNNTTVLPITNNLQNSANTRAAEYHDVIRSVIDISTTSSNFYEETNNTPVFKSDGISATTPITFRYKFHAAQSISGVRIFRHYDNTITGNVADVATKGFCVQAAVVTLFNKDTIIGAGTVNYTLANWGSAAYKDVVIPTTQDADSYEVKITGVFAGSVTGSPWSVWAFAMRPLLKGNPNEITIRTDVTFAGYIEAEAGIKELTVEIPKTISLSSDFTNVPPSRQLYLVLKQKEHLNITDGLYDLETYVSPIAMEASAGVPYGDPRALIGSFESLITHPYWGTTSHQAVLSDSTVETTFTFNSTPFTMTFQYGGQAIVGVNLYVGMFSNYADLAKIRVKLTNSDNVLVMNRTFKPSEFGYSSTPRIEPITNEQRLIELDFNEVFTKISSIEIMFEGASNAGNTVRVLQIAPRLVGLHFNTITKTFYDYQQGINPICVLGKVIPVKLLGEASFSFMPVAFIQDYDGQYAVKMDQTTAVASGQGDTPNSLLLGRMVQPIPRLYSEHMPMIKKSHSYPMLVANGATYSPGIMPILIEEDKGSVFVKNLITQIASETGWVALIE